mmetsp:Transcript_7867/g.14233  ORF Transcript_7867/g.14233 Transcript_7867/m.14233 type:complete len:229 (+) Transcript_7867:2354-3040(+)
MRTKATWMRTSRHTSSRMAMSRPIVYSTGLLLQLWIRKVVVLMKRTMITVMIHRPSKLFTSMMTTIIPRRGGCRHPTQGEGSSRQRQRHLPLIETTMVNPITTTAMATIRIAPNKRKNAALPVKGVNQRRLGMCVPLWRMSSTPLAVITGTPHLQADIPSIRLGILRAKAVLRRAIIVIVVVTANLSIRNPLRLLCPTKNVRCRRPTIRKNSRKHEVMMMVAQNFLKN